MVELDMNARVERRPRKLVRTMADLAINGAQPAFEKTLVVGAPNIGDRSAFLSRVEDMFDRLSLSNDGPLVQELEAKIRDYLGVKHCILVSNGTIGLEILVRALGLSGEVIVPSYTFVATPHALSWLDIDPVFADIDPETHNLEPSSVSRLITPRTTGIAAVHLWGRPADVEALQEIASAHGLKLYFDAAHAFGCSDGAKMIGGFGAAEVFSFHATKFFNTFEGGAITTNEDDLAERLRRMRNFGFAGRDDSRTVGTNGKMSEISAAMGLTNMESINTFIEANQIRYEKYKSVFESVPGVSLLRYDRSSRNNYQYIVVEVFEGNQSSRDDILLALQAENIDARKYFWPGAHRMIAYSDTDGGVRDQLQGTAAVAKRVIVLPTGSNVPLEAIDLIGDVFRVLLTQ